MLRILLGKKIHAHTERPCKQDLNILYMTLVVFKRKKDPNFYLSFRYFCENLISSTSNFRLVTILVLPSCVSYRSVCRKWKGDVITLIIRFIRNHIS